MIRTHLLSSAAAVLIASVTAAGAQTNSTERGRDAAPSATQNSAPAADTMKRDGAAQDQRAPTSAQSTQDQRTRGNAQSTTQSQSGPSTAASPSTSSPSSRTQSSGPSGTSSPSTAQERSGSGTRSTQSQSTTPSQSTTSQPPSATRTSPTAGARGNDSAQTQSSSAPAARSGANVQLNEQQSTRISAAIATQRVTPVTNVNFSISVGTVVPRSVRFHTLPPDIVSIVPQYRGYSYFVTSDQIVIVEPRTYKIVTVLPYSGRGQAATVREKAGKPKFSQSQRQTIRRQVTSGRAPAAVSRTVIDVGEAVPEDVELVEFPTTIYREVPTVREYRYYRTDRNVVVVDPSDRRVIEIIE